MKRTPQKLLLAIILLLVLCIIAAAVSCTLQKKSESPDANNETKPAQTSEVVTKAPIEVTEAPTTTTVPVETQAPITINLVAIGDMLMHKTVNNQAEWSGNWDYSYLFEHTRDTIAAADLAIVNNEVIMGGNDRGNQNYPCFNVRTELGDTEVAIGFDVILNATNHSLDQEVSGLMNTVNFWKENHPDIVSLGIHDTPEQAEQIAIKDVNGIKIAMLNYTYGLEMPDPPAEYSYVVDFLRESNKDKIANDIAKAKEMADCVIVFPHWGTEYELHQTQEQEDWAKFFANHGVDLVIGSHPHVCEPVEWITADDGHQMLCYYSLGNYTSLQSYHFCMLGGMAQVSLTKDATGTHISDYGIRFLVTQYNDDRSVMTTYFLDDYTEELANAHAWTFTEGADAINQDYPFTVEGLKSLAKSICPDLVNY